MRKMYDGFAALPAAAFHGELGKKMQVTKESLQKVENGAWKLDRLNAIDCDLSVLQREGPRLGVPRGDVGANGRVWLPGRRRVKRATKDLCLLRR